MLLNTTLFFLSKKNNAVSPLFSHSEHSTANNFIISKSFFYKSFSNILYSNSDNGIYSIKDSKFQNTLSTALIFERISNKKITFDKKQRNSFVDQLKLVIERTVFTKCLSDKRGGALYVQNDFSTLVIKNSGFRECKSSFTNGAFFFRGRSSSLSQNCFDLCLGRQTCAFSSQAFYVLARNNFNNHFNESSVIKCSTIKKKGKDTPIAFYKGICIIHNANISENALLGKSSGVVLSNICKSFISYNTFFNSTGFSIISMLQFKDTNGISFMNFVANNIKKGALFVISDAKTIVHHSVFIKNTNWIVYATGEWSFQLDSCFIDKEFNKAFNKVKNVKNYRCNFNATNIKTYKIMDIPEMLCWNDCGNNDKCILNLLNFKKYRT